MRNEELDPEGKVELASLLLQIGFKKEAVAEYLMAAGMYKKLTKKDKAKELYRKVLELDSDNQTAKHALAKLQPRSEQDVEKMISEMGFGAEKETPEEVKEEKKEEPGEEKPAAEPAEKKEEVAEVREEKEEVEEAGEIEEKEEEAVEAGEGANIAGIDVNQAIAEVKSLVSSLPDDEKKRHKLARFFTEQGMNQEAFFELEGAYLANPTPKRFKEVVGLLRKAGMEDKLLDFLETESREKRDKALVRSILHMLAEIYEKRGRKKDAERVKEQAEKLEEKMGEKKKKQSLKIIEDIPRVAEEKPETGEGNKKSPDQIQFI